MLKKPPSLQFKASWQSHVAAYSRLNGSRQTDLSCAALSPAYIEALPQTAGLQFVLERVRWAHDCDIPLEQVGIVDQAG